MHAVLHFAQTLASFALVLGVLVSIHELGHYFAARWCGIGVEAFSLGFGPALKSWTDSRGTVWKISALPLGGYVKMHGMSPTARADAAAAGEQYRAQEAFAEKHVGKRAFVAFAGPLANFLLTIVLFTGLLMAVGRQVPLPVVGDVQANSAAAHAGVLVGDRITAVDGVRIEKFTTLQHVISASAGKDIKLSVTRGAQTIVLPVHVDSDGAAGSAHGKLGVISGQAAFERLGPGEAVIEGVTQTWTIGSQIVANIAALITGKQSTEALGGVISIAHLSGQMARQGSLALISFMAILSVNLGLVNLLPIPVLDGGHLMFCAAEAVRGRPVPPRAQEYGYRVGIALIACVFVFASWNDLVREGAFHWVARLRG